MIYSWESRGSREQVREHTPPGAHQRSRSPGWEKTRASTTHHKARARGLPDSSRSTRDSSESIRPPTRTSSDNVRVFSRIAIVLSRMLSRTRRPDRMAAHRPPKITTPDASIVNTATPLLTLPALRAIHHRGNDD